MDRMNLVVLLLICLTQMQRVKTAPMGIGCTAGATYVRWGRNTCGTDSELVYKGFAAGSHYLHSGGGSNHLCLPDKPSWGKYSNTATGHFGYIYGAEYEISSRQSYLLGRSNAGVNSLDDNDVPCALCQSKLHTNVIMVPGKIECFNGWFREYSGMLMTERHSHAGRTEFVCMDANPEVRPSGQANKNGVMFYFVQPKCGSLPCPPYHQNRELPCVVCTN